MITEIVTHYDGEVCYLTLHPPSGKPPTLDHQVIARLEQTLVDVAAQSSRLVAVVVQSASPKFFCAGANLNVMAEINGESIVPWIHRGHQIMNQLEALPVPVIAKVEGYAMGGGLELAMACDLIIASSNARFAQSEAKLGLVTGWGGCYRLVRRVGLARAKELCFTGRMVDAAEALKIGLADWQGDSGALHSHLQFLVNEIRQNSRVAVKEMKHILGTCNLSTLEEAAVVEAEASLRCLTEGDAAQRLEQFLQARSRRSGSNATPSV